MARWMTYLRERFPPATYAILCGGFSASGYAASGAPASALPVALSFLGILLMFAELRLMDDLKDYGKDQVAHPGRPLPRRLLNPAEVATVIRVGFAGMIGFAAAAALALNPAASALFLGFSLYLWLMYHEFFIGEGLARSPLLYAATHQVIIIPICLFTVAALDPSRAFSPIAIAYSVTVLGGFFAYEVCRKLDPAAHPILGTYLSIYGAPKTALLICGLLSLAAWGASDLGAARWLVPAEAMLAAAVAIWTRRQSLYNVVEAVASVSLILHIWSAFIQRLIQTFWEPSV